MNWWALGVGVEPSLPVSIAFLWDDSGRKWCDPIRGQFIKCKHMHRGTTAICPFKSFLRLGKPRPSHMPGLEINAEVQHFVKESCSGGATIGSAVFFFLNQDNSSEEVYTVAFECRFLKACSSGACSLAEFQSSAYFQRACWRGGKKKTPVEAGK